MYILVWFHGNFSRIPKALITEFLNSHPEIVDSPSYTVQASVSSDSFRTFVDSLVNGLKPTISATNAYDLFQLGNEFKLAELGHDSAMFAFQALSRLTNPNSELEAQASSPSSALRNFPLQGPGSLRGIVSFLTTKHNGNVHDSGIVTITAKSPLVDPLDNSKFAVRNLVDLRSSTAYLSENTPDQWVSFDFGNKRINMGHYTLLNRAMKSWVIEGSIDGANWSEIDRQQDTDVFAIEVNLVTFKAANHVEARFIRLRQLDQNHFGNDDMCFYAIEFFGTLRE
jgi:hypothetical protein